MPRHCSIGTGNTRANKIEKKYLPSCSLYSSKGAVDKQKAKCRVYQMMNNTYYRKKKRQRRELGYAGVGVGAGCTVVSNK